jgi:hypothetical protein
MAKSNKNNGLTGTVRVFPAFCMIIAIGGIFMYDLCQLADISFHDACR